MNKLLLSLLIVAAALQVSAQSEQKTLAPLFTVDKVEILCCNNNFKNNAKKIHIISSAGTSVFTDISVQIKDQSGIVIATYGPMSQDYTSPCVNLAGGSVYTVNIINSSNQIMTDINFDNVPNELCTYIINAPKCGFEKNIISTGPFKPKWSFYGAIHYTSFIPEIKIPNFGNLNDKRTSGLSLSFEMALPNKKGVQRKLIPALELGVSYNTLSYDNGVNMLTKKYPALAASESKMMNAFTEKVSNKLLVVSLTPKLVMPLGKLNISAGAGLAYIRHGFHGIDVKDELIKTNTNQPLTYAVSSGYPPPYGPRGMFGGDFKLSVSYWLTKHIALTAGSGYLLSPNYNSKILLLNATDANGDKLYSSGELRNGTMQLQEYNYSLRSFRGNVGLQIALSRKHEYHGHVTLLR